MSDCTFLIATGSGTLARNNIFGWAQNVEFFNICIFLLLVLQRKTDGTILSYDCDLVHILCIAYCLKIDVRFKRLLFINKIQWKATGDKVAENIESFLSNVKMIDIFKLKCLLHLLRACMRLCVCLCVCRL